MASGWANDDALTNKSTVQLKMRLHALAVKFRAVKVSMNVKSAEK